MDIQVNNYLLLDKLLFKLIMPNLMGIYTPLLCIPSSMVEF